MEKVDLRKAGLDRLIAGPVLFAEPADRHTSMGVGGPIDALAFPESREELARLVAFLGQQRIPFLPVGNWTNLIVRGGGYRGVLISLSGLRRLTRSDNPDGTVLLEAEAGVALSELVNLSQREALTGIEFCAGIPGSVGGAVRMNAGAYGGEIKDVCNSIQSLTTDKGIRTLKRKDLPFAYRILDLPAEMIIIGAAFCLQRGKGEVVAATVRDFLSRRKDKHPLEFRNAGSIFKNPREIPAGQLIEQTGLKGMRLGDAQVSEKHGNFIVNRGQATAEEILTLLDLVQKRVFEATGQFLEPEVKIIGVP
ncbi:MAG: UDP-N-acetylmuramate dehydrogenase [Deltaproteobacteria bacterium]|nr:UDP-N-acetylmuramate dehydrogenase [Deltaproteobacteria bacterium]